MTTIDLTPGSESAEPNHPGVWRALSLLLVMIVSVVLVIWTLQSRSASNDAFENRRTLDADTTTVTVTGQDVPTSAAVSLLGADGRVRTPIEGTGASLPIPTRVSAILALYDGNGDVHGLTLVLPGSDRASIEISPTTTARTLLVLAPAVLDADVGRSIESLESIEADQAFLDLVDAVTESPNLSSANRAVELAVAAILDRIQRRARPDQGCDSVISASAVAITGTCVQPGSDGASVSNEQDRWVLAFGGPEPWSTVCAAIAPTDTPGDEQSLTSGDCGAQALLVAPGALSTSASNDAAVVNRVQVAAAIDLFGAYAAPLLDLTGGVAGLNRPDNTHVFGELDELVATSSGLIAQDPGFDSATQVLIEPATPIARHAAMLGATRSLVAGAGSFVPRWDGDSSSHDFVLDFYDRVGERMEIVDRETRRWSADASGIVAIGTGS